MSDRQSNSAEERASRSSKLPLLTYTLLALMALHGVVWLLFYRPSEATQRRMKAMRQMLDYIPENYIGEAEAEGLFQAAMRGMVQSLDDKYSAYITPEENRVLREQTRGEFSGIGVTISQTDGLPLVVGVMKESPALESGIQVGDLIVGIEGADVQGTSLEEIARRIRGKAGTEVTITVRRPATDERLTKTLQRATMDLPSVTWDLRDDGIGVVDVVSFDQNCARLTKQALSELRQEGELRGLILDLRGNSGGLVEQAVAVCDMFISGGPLLSTQGRDKGENKSFRASSEVVLAESVPVAVLVNEATASAAEILSGVLQARDRATVVGAPTVGKGSVTSVITLANQGGLILTVARYELPGDKVVEGKGITADIPVGKMPPIPTRDDAEALSAWVEELKRAGEAQFEAAVEYLHEQMETE